MAAPPELLATAEFVLFDLDGTLVASGPGILASVRYALTRLGAPVPPDDVLDQFVGPPLVQSFQRLCGMDPQQAWTAVLTYREYYAVRGQFEAAVYAGIPEALIGLRASGRRLAVATSKAEMYARSVLEHFGLAAHFTEVVGSELDGRRTAKSEVITEALGRLAAAPGPAVMVGDRALDVLGARTVGMRSIGALWGYGSRTELTEAGADALAGSPGELLGPPPGR